MSCSPIQAPSSSISGSPRSSMTPGSPAPASSLGLPATSIPSCSAGPPRTNSVTGGAGPPSSSSPRPAARRSDRVRSRRCSPAPKRAGSTSREYRSRSRPPSPTPSRRNRRRGSHPRRSLTSSAPSRVARRCPGWSCPPPQPRFAPAPVSDVRSAAASGSPVPVPEPPAPPPSAPPASPSPPAPARHPALPPTTAMPGAAYPHPPVYPPGSHPPPPGLGPQDPARQSVVEAWPDLPAQPPAMSVRPPRPRALATFGLWVALVSIGLVWPGAALVAFVAGVLLTATIGSAGRELRKRRNWYGRRRRDVVLLLLTSPIHVLLGVLRSVPGLLLGVFLGAVGWILVSQADAFLAGPAALALVTFVFWWLPPSSYSREGTRMILGVGGARATGVWLVIAGILVVAMLALADGSLTWAPLPEPPSVDFSGVS